MISAESSTAPSLNNPAKLQPLFRAAPGLAYQPHNAHTHPRNARERPVLSPIVAHT